MDHATPANLEPPPTRTSDGPELPGHLLEKLRVTVPGYALLDPIASGGQATVYRARELTSGLTVAIKVLNDGTHAGPAARERLLRETAALRALNHPNIVCVIEAGRTSVGLDFIVMNHVDGRPLDALWTDLAFAAAVAPEPPARLRLFKRICDVVQVAHRKGITHRDLSPSNILVTADGEPHILDFGLASTAFDHLLSPAGRNVTVTGQFIGKLKYASPEQARGDRGTIDIRTDVYALGVILYQILTDGAYPYEVVGALVDVLNHIIHTAPLPPSSRLRNELSKAVSAKPRQGDPRLVNETIEAVVLKALEKNPADRYQSAGELAADIDQYLAGRPTPAVARRGAAVTRRLPRKRAKLTLTVIVLVLISGALMNARILLNWVGLSGLAIALGVGPAAPPAGNPNGPALTDRQQNLLLQLSDAEANIQAINRSLKDTGYKVGSAYDRIDSNLRGNETMDRKGGGPVRWDEFYGKTARDYARNGDGWYGDHRPLQFAYVYKANNDQIARARDQIASLSRNQDALLERRRKHEDDQSRLWATLAWEQVKDREIGVRSLYRHALVPAGREAATLRPIILFLRTADAVANDGLVSVQADQPQTFQSGSRRMEAAYTKLQEELADDLEGGELKPKEVDEGKALKSICKDLAEECKVIAENYDNALDRDRAKEDGSKLQFRGQLQGSLSSFAAGVARLDDQIVATAKGWAITADKTTATPDALLEVAVQHPDAGTGSGADSHPEPWRSLIGAWKVHNKSTNFDATEIFNADGTCTSLMENRADVSGKWTLENGKVKANWDNGVRKVYSYEAGARVMQGTSYNKGNEYLAEATKIADRDAPGTVPESPGPETGTRTGTASGPGIWTNLFDPAQLGQWSTADDGSTVRPGPDGVAILRNKNYMWGPAVHDATIRASVRKANGRGDASLYLRKRVDDRSGYKAGFDGSRGLFIGVFIDGKWRALAAAHTARTLPDFFVMQFSAIGDQLVLVVDGQEMIHIQDDQVKEGSVGIGELRGESWFKDVRVQVTDRP